MEKLTVLTIDDDQDILSLVELLLKKKGCTVLKAESGEKALALIEDVKPDIILLDVMMGEVSGYEVCAKIQEREDLSFIPVIFLTALSSEQDKARAFSLGAVDFLTKPIGKETLYAVLEKHSTTENKWKRFILRKEDSRAPGQRAKTGKPERRSFAAFREFLFDFLNIPDDERERMKMLKTSQLYKALHDTRGFEPSRLALLIAQFVGHEYLPDIETANLLLDVLPPTFSKRNNVAAVSIGGGFAFVVSDPFNIEVLDILESMRPLKIFVSPPDVFAVLYKTSDHEEEDISALAQSVRDLYPVREGADAADDDAASDTDLIYRNLNASPLVRFVNQIIEDAYAMQASDIHIEPQEKSIVIRYRIDGELRIISRLQPRRLINPIGSRVKIMAGINIAERRMPQDGRIVFKQFTAKPLDFDLRVSCAPMQYGEKIVMRILDKRRTLLPLESMGFSAQALSLYREKIRTPYGMVLHVGPTGSGKSMSLYSALNEINRPNINIQTAEDPIEYTLQGINQMQVNPAIGLTFKEALRSFLRQDPDAILVGEIRDRVTAEIAVEAALTGHLLFSTLHTNDAPSTMSRFVEMGIEPYLVSSSVVLICAQRLLRRLCSACKEPYSPNESERRLAEVPPADTVSFYRPVGCPVCNNTGYKGRVGIYELLAPNDALRAAMSSERINTEAIRRVGIEECGMITLFRDAMEKVRAGITSFSEAVSKTKTEE
ncbi:MAG: ATPase, T2SS/T4P/T4SS family [Thermodesulfovibrionales bacterium]